MLIKSSNLMQKGSLERNKEIGPTELENRSIPRKKPVARVLAKSSGRTNTTRGRHSSVKKSASTESNSTVGPSSGGGRFTAGSKVSRTSSYDTMTPSKHVIGKSGSKIQKAGSTIKLSNKQINLVKTVTYQ